MTKCKVIYDKGRHYYNAWECNVCGRFVKGYDDICPACLTAGPDVYPIWYYYKRDKLIVATPPEWARASD